jgi:uncharacterized membrane protein YoaK (UPF0700 family)
MENISYDQPHTSTQSTPTTLTHIGIIILFLVGVLVAGLVGTFLGRVDILTVALTNMRQECLMERQP